MSNEFDDDVSVGESNPVLEPDDDGLPDIEVPEIVSPDEADVINPVGHEDGGDE